MPYKDPKKQKEYQRNYQRKYNKTAKQKKYLQEWHLKNKDRRNAEAKKWYLKNRKKHLRKNKEWRKNNVLTIKKYHARWLAENRELRNTYLRNRLRKNPHIRVDKNIGRLMTFSLKNNGIRTSKNWKMLVDYSLGDLLKHLEKNFDKKMTWNNYGIYWHIDHIIPRNTFYYKSIKDNQFKKCWSLKNLRPLAVTDNLKRPKNGNDLTKQPCKNTEN